MTRRTRQRFFMRQAKTEARAKEFRLSRGARNNEKRPGRNYVHRRTRVADVQGFAVAGRPPMFA